MSTFTPNLDLELVARNADVGTWDTPTNSNWSVVDLAIGGIATISLNNSPVVLSAAQFQSRQITFSSTLTGSVIITFPTSFTKDYDIYNSCTGSSAFTITLETTASGGQVICCPPGEIIECVNDGTNLKYKNFGGRIGSYMDFGGSSTPNWNDGCTVPPYLNCIGGSISSAIYPVLFGLFGATAPDARGEARFTLNQGVSRLTSAGAGIDGNTVKAQGGFNGVTLGANQVPSIAVSGTVTVYPNGDSNGRVAYEDNGVFNGGLNLSAGSGGNFAAATNSGGWTAASAFSATNTLNYTNASQAITPATVPGYVGGITLIRAG